MASKDDRGDNRSVSGQVETAEPPDTTANTVPTKKESNTQSPMSNTQLPQTPSSSIPALRKSSSTNLAPTVSSPLAQSPRTSRNTSPIRKDRPPATAANTLSAQPSAAAIQRALSASSVPQLHQQSGSVTDAVSKLPRAGSKSTTASGENTPAWPVSPRLKSPPPSGLNSRRGSGAPQKRNEAPTIQVVSATSQTNSPSLQPARQLSSDKPKPEPAQLQPPPGPKSSSRGASGKSILETVQENSSDSQEPSPAAIQAAADLKPLTKISDEEAGSWVSGKVEDTKQSQPAESGSESAGNKSDTTKRGRRNSSSQTTTNNNAPRSRNASRSAYSTSTMKSRPGEGKQNMTVETETVQSIPQSGLAPASESANRLRTDGGSVKLKPSTETIRPKKERKKAERKTRSINQGSTATKADLFEARVANYVEEANDSDSDETFVYESNPPEPQRRQRHHSRTPSVTSSHSVADQPRGALRSFGESHDGPRVGGKRSMKFSSNPYTEVDSHESKDGTVRAHTPRHIGRFGRGGHHSASYEQQESPYTQASRARHSHLQRSRPTSPKSAHTGNMQIRSGGSLFSGGRKQEPPYDFDVEQNADDERQPLLGSGSVRGPRIRNQRRMGSSRTQSLHDGRDDGRHWKCFSGRTGSCLLTSLVIGLVVFSMAIFFFASNRSLQNVEIKKIKNVLASEEELMLDLVVGAINPNTLTVMISDMDLNIFAKSKHAGSGHSTLTRRRSLSRSLALEPEKYSTSQTNPSQDLSGHWHAPKPLPDVDRDSQTMLLGRIFHFDSGLGFSPSPLKLQEHLSSGQVRLRRPGNETEAGGSARWEKMIQGEFELIVRGYLKYQLPISSRQQTAAVGASVTVHPEDGIDQNGNMRSEPVDHSEHWQWVDLPPETGSDDT